MCGGGLEEREPTKAKAYISLVTVHGPFNHAITKCQLSPTSKSTSAILTCPTPPNNNNDVSTRPKRIYHHFQGPKQMTKERTGRGGQAHDDQNGHK